VAGKRVERRSPGKTKPAYRFAERKGDHSYTGFGFRAYPADHEDISALTVLNTILGGGMSSRLFQKIREERALVYSVFSTVEQDSDAGSLSAYMSSTKENVIESITACASVCRELRDDGLAKGELERAKNLIKGAGSRQLESTVNRSYRMARRFMLTGKPESFTERMKALDAVSEEDVMRVASDIISEKNLAVAVYGTKSRDIKGFSIDRIGI
jgi:predicted Zn-dependent peptidase